MEDKQETLNEKILARLVSLPSENWNPVIKNRTPSNDGGLVITFDGFKARMSEIPSEYAPIEVSLEIYDLSSDLGWPILWTQGNEFSQLGRTYKSIREGIKKYYETRNERLTNASLKRLEKLLG